MACKISKINDIQWWSINGLLLDKSEKKAKKNHKRDFTLTDLLPIEVMPELYDKAICSMLSENALDAIKIYNEIDIVEVHELLAIKNALNFYEDD